MLPPTPDLREWHDFYSLIGTASATLVGLMFVAASIGAGVFTRDHQIGIRSFLSPTVVHFSAALIICLLATMPTQTWPRLGLFQTGTGAIGLVYSAWIWRRMMKLPKSTSSTVSGMRCCRWEPICRSSPPGWIFGDNPRRAWIFWPWRSFCCC
jgi:hypothetical protein